MIALVNASAGRIPLPDGVVHCSAGSPPFWSLRAYKGNQARDWPEVVYSPMPGLRYEWIIDEDGVPELCGIPDGPGEYQITIPPMTCALGHEATPEAFIGHLVLCYREVYRVLRDDGVAWLNIGDSFAGSWGNYAPGGIKGEQRIQTEEGRRWDRPGYSDTKWRPPASSMKQGDLCLIPHRLALALQADGWLVRNDVIWAKKSPMPESVAGWRWERHKIKIAPGRPPANQTHLPDDGQRPGGNRGNQWGDVQNQPNAQWSPCPGCATCDKHDGYVLRRGSWRHTRAHEFVLMLTKKMNYFADQEAVREASTGQTGAAANFRRETKDHLIPGQAAIQHRIDRPDTEDNPSGRNPRSVVSPKPSSYSGKHYATFPPSLIEPLIKATCPERCCPECGAGWASVVEREKVHCSDLGINTPGKQHGRGQRKTEAQLIGKDRDHWNDMSYLNQNTVIDHRPTCACGREDSQPGIVLDPFAGSGTTGFEARRQGKRAVLLDLSYEYLHDQARERLGFVALAEWEHGRDGTGEPLDTLPLFAEVT